jgi:hypothetical protein
LNCKFDLQPVDVLHERRIDLPKPTPDRFAKSIRQIDLPNGCVDRTPDGWMCCVARTPDRFAKSIRQIDLAIRIGNSNLIRRIGNSIWRFYLAILFGGNSIGRFATSICLIDLPDPSA